MITNIYSNSIYMILSIMFFALALDLVISELPAKIHPVVWIGKSITFFKKRFINIHNKFSGVLLFICVTITSLLIVLVPLGLIKHFLYLNENMIYLFKVAAIILLSSSFSVKLLLTSASNIEKPLRDNNIKEARKLVSYLVSRNTKELSKEQVISAAIETLSENIPDSYVSTIFYFVIVGLIAAFLGLNDFTVIIIATAAAFTHRIVNTLDAMVGYKNEELIDIGWFSAKLDDVLNFIPARLSGIAIIVSALFLKYNWRGAYYVMKRDASELESPNSGYSMAPVAGALDIQLEKEGHYVLGSSINKLKVEDIKRAIDLSRLSIFLVTMFFIFILLDVLLYLL